MRISLTCSLASILMSAFLQNLSGASHPEVLVVYNTNYSDSLAVANHYMAARDIPPTNLCAITPPANDDLGSFGDYTTYVKTPIQNCLNAVGPKTILYIVMSYLTPYTLPAGPFGTAAVDSYLADIWDKYATQPFLITPSVTQPYYADAQSQGNVYQPFQSFAAYRAGARSILIYSVWRLDGPSMAIASALVDNAVQAENQGGPQGQACIDRRFGNLNANGYPDAGYTSGDWDLRQAAAFLGQAGLAVVEDANEAEFGTAPAPLTCPDTALYSGWYSFNNYNNAFTWQPGSIGWHLDSAAALHLRWGSAWVPNALLNNITVTTGAVQEPYLEGMVRPGGAFLNLLEGASVGDAFLRNTRWIKWEIVNVGDPLYTPFAGGRAPFNPPPPMNSLQISPQEIVGGTKTTGTITLGSAAPAGGTTFSLGAAGPVSVPSTVTVAGGATKATFPISTAAVTASAATVLTATNGPVTLNNTIITDPLLGALVGSIPTTMAGIPVTVTAILNGRAPTGGAVINLSTDNTAVTVPPTVTVPAGSTVATFTAQTTGVESAVGTNIYGTYAGATTSVSLLLVPGLYSMDASPLSINAGGTSNIEVFTGTYVPSGCTATVSFTSSDPTSFSVPPSVVIGPGSHYGAVQGTSSPGSSGKVVTVTATYGGSTLTTTVTIN